MSHNKVVLTANNGSSVYIVGIKLFSDRSQEEVAVVMNKVKPNSVVIELCPNRKHLLSMDNDLPPITSPSHVPEGLENSTKEIGISEQYVLSVLTHSIYMSLGAEYRKAAVEAKKYCNHVCLGDRPLSITIKRLISMMGWIKIIRFIALVHSQLKNCKNEQGELDLNANNPAIKILQAEMADNYSEIEEVLLDERNKCFAYVLQKHAGIQIEKAGVHVKEVSNIVVGVVESSNIPGIVKYWGTITKEEYEQLSVILPESRTTKAIKFVCKASFYSMLLWGIIKTSKALKRILI